MISVLTATFNAQATLPRLAQSLREQTHRDFEWIVADGGSGDGTCEFLSQSDDVVTRWVSEPDFGIYHALNKALAMARGDYYIVLGADDELTPGALHAYAQAAERTRADIISAPVWIDGRRVAPRRTAAWLRSGPPGVSAHSVGSLIRRGLHAELGLYSRRLPIAADTLFLLSARKAGKRFAYIDDVAGRFGTGGVSSTDVLGGLTESMRAHILVQGQWPLHVLLFVLRVLRNALRLGRRA